MGGLLSTERETIATASRELQGQRISTVSRSRGAGGSVGSYENGRDILDKDARTPKFVTYFVNPLFYARACYMCKRAFSIFKLKSHYSRIILTLLFSSLVSDYRSTFNAAKMAQRRARAKHLTDVREALRG